MANRERGEVSFQADGKTYTLRMDLNALAEMETALSMDGGKALRFQDALKLAERGHLREIRALLWGGLRAHHPMVSVQDVGDLILQLGGISGIEQQLKNALQASMPEAKDAKPANPLKARRNGHGARSTSGPGASGFRAQSSGR